MYNLLQQKRVMKRWEKVFAKDTKIISSKNNECYNSLKALIIGYIIGDGSIAKRKSRNGVHYEIYFYPDDEGMITAFTKAYYELYGRKVNIKQLINHYRLHIKHKAAVIDLMDITTYNSAVWRIPTKILSSDQSKINFLRAYFDCEGYISKKYIRVESVNNIGLLQVQNLLK